MDTHNSARDGMPEEPVARSNDGARAWFRKGHKEGHYEVYGFVEREYRHFRLAEAKELGQRHVLEVVSGEWYGTSWWRKLFDRDCPVYHSIAMVVDTPRKRGHAFFEVVRPSLEFPGSFELVPLEERLD